MAMSRLRGKRLVIQLAVFIQSLLKLGELIKGLIFPDEIPLRTMGTLHLRLVSGAMRTAQHMGDPQTHQP